MNNINKTITPEEAWDFVEKHHLQVSPLMVNCQKTPRCWHVGQVVLAGNGIQNICNWLIQGKTAIEAVSIAKEWIETGKVHDIYNKGILNNKQG